MRRRLSTIFVLLAALSAAGAALAVVGGSPDNGAHPYVGAALQQQIHNGVTGTEYCSGSLLSATVFVTAAHCFADGSTVQVTFEENARTASTFYKGTVHVEPGFCLGCSPGLPGADTNDVAVVVLKGKGAPQSRYVQLPSVGLDDTLSTNQLVDVVGYGIEGFSSPGTPSSFGSREVATAKVISVGSEFLKLSADPGACLGDSGGPDLLHGGDVMVSITTYSAGNPLCNGTSYSERLDTGAAQSFVRSFL